MPGGVVEGLCRQCPRRAIVRAERGGDPAAHLYERVEPASPGPRSAVTPRGQPNLNQVGVAYGQVRLPEPETRERARAVSDQHSVSPAQQLLAHTIEGQIEH